MTNDAILRGMVRVAMYHGLPKNDWMAKVVPGVEEQLGTPLSEATVDQIHQAFKDEMSPEMARRFAFLTDLERPGFRDRHGIQEGYLRGFLVSVIVVLVVTSAPACRNASITAEIICSPRRSS